MRRILLLLVLLAGCADVEPEQSCDDCEAAPLTGGIRGVTVDEAIVPLGNVTVTITPGDHVATSDEDGRWEVPRLDPGPYTATATHRFYETVQTTFTVGPEGTSPPLLRIQLTRVIFDDPYIETAVFDGFLACSSNVGGVIAEECGEGVGVEGFGRIGGHPNNQPFVTFFAEGPRPATIQAEILWEPTITLNDDIQSGGFTAIMATHFACEPICAYEDSLDDKVGDSPLVMRTDDGDQGGAYFTAPDVSMEAANITADTPITVFVWQSDEDLAGVTMEQPFSVYRTVSYVLPLPEDWSFARGDPDPF